MNTITSDPGLPGGPLSHARPTAPTFCFTTSCVRSRLFYATDGFGAAQKLLLDLLAIFDELATTSRAGGVR